MQSRDLKSLKSAAMPRRSSLFWDVDPKTIDPKKHSRYVIERILEFGRDKEVRWLVRYYSGRTIKNALREKRSPLHEKTKALWELIYR